MQGWGFSASVRCCYVYVYVCRLIRVRCSVYVQVHGLGVYVWVQVSSVNAWMQVSSVYVQVHVSAVGAGVCVLHLHNTFP